jgi:hypothetical protein
MFRVLAIIRTEFQRINLLPQVHQIGKHHFNDRIVSNDGPCASTSPCPIQKYLRDQNKDGVPSMFCPLSKNLTAIPYKRFFAPEIPCHQSWRLL